MSEEGAPPQYAAFISYSHRDDKVARWLHGAIENYRVPKEIVGTTGEFGIVPRRLGRVFRDEEELSGAAELGPKLEAALRGSAALVVICSTTSAKSKWVDHEIRFFKQVNPGRPVLAVIADGVPGTDEECFPESLHYHVRDDGSLDTDHPSEPLAPDLTKLEQGVVKLKLIAGLLGVGYNELNRREVKRRRRQIALLGGLASAVIIALTVLSVIAVGYARLAVKQRNIAEEQRKIAVHNAEEAEKKAWLANIAAEACRQDPSLLERR